MIHKLFAVAGRIYQRMRPVRSESYRAYVRSWPCIACGTVSRLRDAMHTGPHGLGQKASDLDCLPGCRRCHRELHRLGPVRFQLLHSLDFAEAIATVRHFYTVKHGRLPEDAERRAA